MQVKDLDARYRRLTEQERRLQSLALTDGVMDAIPTDYPITDSTALGILDQYLGDVERRLAILQEPASQLTLFQNTLNSMLEFKTLQYTYTPTLRGSQKGGLRAVDDRGNEIPLEALSSGEQHLCVMFGRILFEPRVHNGAIVLLDEPEISLHPQWQIAISRALRQVADTNKCGMILATHSPTMIGDDWENEVSMSDGSNAT